MLKLRNPVLDEHMLREIRSAMTASDTPRAILLACRALADGLSDPLLFYLRSQALMQQGRYEEAAGDLHRAVSLAPANAGMRNACGMDLVRLQRPLEAIAILEEAVRLEPNFPPGHFNLGWAHERAGELARAIACYEKAIALHSRYADALARLAGLSLRLGDSKSARDYADRALAIDGREYHALSTQVNIALNGQDFERAEEFVQRLLDLSNLPADDHATALGLLGDVRHAQGRFAEAFEAYAAGNAEKQRFFEPRFGRPDVESFTSYATWLAEYFERAQPSQWRVRKAESTPDGSVSEAVIHAFIAGFPRSGTTLLENVLASHPQTSTLAEKGTMADAVRTLLSNEGGRKRLASLDANEANETRRIYWQRVKEFGAIVDGKTLVDENPLNSLWLPLIAKLFPRAKVIFAVRDPRDVVLSCFRRRFEMNLAMYEFVSLERAANFYSATMRLVAICREVLGLDWCDVRHELLVDDFETEVGKICDFLGLPYNPGMRDFGERAKVRAITTASAPQIVRGLSSEGVGQWRNYTRELEPILPILGPWVVKFGYPAG